jgi:DNA-binding MarR family transcriptional regulator
VGRIDNRTVRLHSHPVVSPDLTFLEQFNYESLLILKELYRFGPRSIRQLIEETHIRDTFLAREVESLRQTGLVTNKSKDGHIIQIDVLAKYYIGEQLHHLQII